jgi:hypothetical protein
VYGLPRLPANWKDYNPEIRWGKLNPNIVGHPKVEIVGGYDEAATRLMRDKG